MVPELEKLQAAGELEIISVSLDTESTLPQMKDLIREHDIDFPVVYGSDAATDWGCRMVPSSYLVDPQGVIAASCRTASLERSLELCKAPDYSPFTVSAVHGKLKDGKVSITVQAGSLKHVPLSVSLNISPTVYETDSGELGGIISGRRQTSYLSDFAVLSADQLDEFGEATFVIPVTLEVDWDGIFYQILVMPKDHESDLSHWAAASCMGNVDFSSYEDGPEGRRLIRRWSTSTDSLQPGDQQP